MPFSFPAPLTLFRPVWWRSDDIVSLESHQTLSNLLLVLILFNLLNHFFRKNYTAIKRVKEFFVHYCAVSCSFAVNRMWGDVLLYLCFTSTSLLKTIIRLSEVMTFFDIFKKFFKRQKKRNRFHQQMIFYCLLYMFGLWGNFSHTSSEALILLFA